MIHLLCRNKVADFDKWKKVFDSHTEAHQESGLRLLNLWRSLDDENDVYFLFEVSDIDKANAFMKTPEAAEAGRISGVIDGEVRFLKTGEGH